MWKYVVFYAYYYNEIKYEGRLFHSRATPITSQEVFKAVERSVMDTKKREYVYGSNVIVTGFILLDKPSVLARMWAGLTRKGETK